MVDTWKEVAFKDEVAALGTATPAATDGSAASAGSATAASDREASPTQEWGVHLTGTSTGNKTIYGSYSGNAGSAYYDESSGTNKHVT